MLTRGLCVVHRQAVDALLSFPFLVFVPAQVYLTHARPTGYDRTGALCATLSSGEVKQKFALDQERGARKAATRRKQTWRQQREHRRKRSWTEGQRGPLS